MSTFNPVCEICLKSRNLKIHDKCSKIKQARGLASKKKPKAPVTNKTYGQPRQLGIFLKMIGE